MPRADEPFRFIGVQQHTLIIDENGFLSAISIDRASRAFFNSANASVGKERSTIYGEEAEITNEHQILEG